MAIAGEVQEVEQQSMVLEELGLPVVQPKTVREDNKVDHPGNHQRT